MISEYGNKGGISQCNGARYVGSEGKIFYIDAKILYGLFISKPTYAEVSFDNTVRLADTLNTKDNAETEYALEVETQILPKKYR